MKNLDRKTARSTKAPAQKELVNAMALMLLLINSLLCLDNATTRPLYLGAVIVLTVILATLGIKALLLRWQEAGNQA